MLTVLLSCHFYPYISFIMGLRMLLSSSPVLLQIFCTCFSNFWHCHPYILQHFVFTIFIYMLWVLLVLMQCRPVHGAFLNSHRQGHNYEKTKCSVCIELTYRLIQDIPISQCSPEYPYRHSQVSGAVQVPPFSQTGLHTAMKVKYS